jgi:hypothetical protein
MGIVGLTTAQDDHFVGYHLGPEVSLSIVVLPTHAV